VQGRDGRIAASLLRLDLVILDELGYLPFSQAGVPSAEQADQIRWQVVHDHDAQST
jgi:DNA replication protein DnaC